MTLMRPRFRLLMSGILLSLPNSAWSGGNMAELHSSLAARSEYLFFRPDSQPSIVIIILFFCRFRKAIESAQSAADLKLHLEKYHAQIKEVQITVAEKTSSLEAEAFKTKRLHEELVLMRRKVGRPGRTTRLTIRSGTIFC